MQALTTTRSVATRRFNALVAAVGELVDAAIERVIVSDRRVRSATEAKRLLAGKNGSAELADKIQGVVALSAPVVRRLARGARFARLPWIMVVSRSLSIGVAVRTGVRELQVLASLIADRIEQSTGERSDPTLVKNLAIDLYLHPRRTPDARDDRLRTVRLTRKWLFQGVFDRSSARRTAKALDAAERLDVRTLSR
jgi:hypothetical protein